MSRSYEFSKAANAQPLEVPSGMEGVTPDPTVWWSERTKESGDVNPTVSYEDTPTEIIAHLSAVESLSEADWKSEAKVVPLLEAIDPEHIVVASASGKVEKGWKIKTFEPPVAGEQDEEGNSRGEVPLRVVIAREIDRNGSREEIKRSIPITEFIQMQEAPGNAKQAKRLEKIQSLPNKPATRTVLDGVTAHEQNADDDAEIGDMLGRKYRIRRFGRAMVHRIVEIDGKSDLRRADKGLKRAKRRRDATTNPALRELRQRDVDLAERIQQGAHNRLAGNDMQQHEYLAGLKHKRSEALVEKRLWSDLRGSEGATKREARQIIDRMPREQRDRVGRLVLAEYAAERKQHSASRSVKKLDKAYERSEKRFEKAKGNHREAEHAKNKTLYEIAAIEAAQLPAAETAFYDAQQAARDYTGNDPSERTRLVQTRSEAQTELQAVRDGIAKLRKAATDYREQQKLERARYNHHKGQAEGHDQQRKEVQHNNDLLSDASRFSQLRAHQQMDHGYYVTGRRIAKRNQAIRREAAARRLEAARTKPTTKAKPEIEAEKAKPKRKAKPEVRGK